MDNSTLAAIITSAVNLFSLLGLGVYLVKTKHVTLDNVRARLVQAELDIVEWRKKLEDYYGDHKTNIDALKQTVEGFINGQLLANSSVDDKKDVTVVSHPAIQAPPLRSPADVGPASQAVLKQQP